MVDMKKNMTENKWLVGKIKLILVCVENGQAFVLYENLQPPQFEM